MAQDNARDDEVIRGVPVIVVERTPIPERITLPPALLSRSCVVNLLVALIYMTIGFLTVLGASLLLFGW